MIDDNITKLRRQLLSDNEDAYLQAAFKLHKMGYVALEFAQSLAKDKSPETRQRVCLVLGRILKPPEYQTDLVKPAYLEEAVPILWELLTTDFDPFVRSAAGYALSLHRSIEALPLLLQEVNCQFPAIRQELAMTLGIYGSKHSALSDIEHFLPQIADALLQLMKDEDPNVCDYAVFAVHQTGIDSPAIREQLRTLLKHTSTDVRGEACVALALLQEAGFRAMLEGILLNDKGISPCCFEAAEIMEDVSLLPAVMSAAERWREEMGEGEELHKMIISAIQSLQNLKDQ